MFLDLGAGDGEYRSITLPLERDLGWSGLLVEPNPRLYKKLLKKARKSSASRVCVSPYSYPAKVSGRLAFHSWQNTQNTYLYNTLHQSDILIVPEKTLQLKLSYPKVKEGASEEEEVAQLGKTRVDVLWDKVRGNCGEVNT